MLKEKCVYCLKEFPPQSMRSHVLTCSSLSYLSDDNTDDFRGENSARPDIQPSNDNNLEKQQKFKSM